MFIENFEELEMNFKVSLYFFYKNELKQGICYRIFDMDIKSFEKNILYTSRKIINFITGYVKKKIFISYTRKTFS